MPKGRDPRQIIIQPIVTEKSTRVMEYDQYTFKVAKDANKIEIQHAIEEIFEVEVDKVRTQNYGGKKRRIRYKQFKKPDWKKAVVTLKEGHRINVF